MLQHFDRFYMTDDKLLLLRRCDEVNELLKGAYWVTERASETMRRAMEHSLNYAVFEVESDRLVGFARVVTDYATVYYLCDVFIAEEFRGMGLGKKLVEWIVCREEKLGSVNGLLKTGDAKTLYEKYGFEECQAVCMVQKRN